LKPKNTAPAKPKAPTSDGYFLETFKNSHKWTQYNAEKLADIDGNLANRYIKADAVNDRFKICIAYYIDREVSRLRTRLFRRQILLVDIDTVYMRANIKDSKYNLSSDDQIKYGRAINFFDTWRPITHR
jgi:hypothetical protein